MKPPKRPPQLRILITQLKQGLNEVFIEARYSRQTMKLHDIGEEQFLAQLVPDLPIPKAVVSGAGDDCAVVKTRDRRHFLVLKTDCVVAGVHFLSTAGAREVGWKAMMRPLSDFAATSALPQFALITFIAPEQTKLEWVKELYRGLRRAAKRFKVS